jgi:hypothetical protein
MEKKKCHLCKKIYTRRWNLERHLQDVHKIYDNTKKDNKIQKLLIIMNCQTILIEIVILGIRIMKTT